MAVLGLLTEKLGGGDTHRNYSRVCKSEIITFTIYSRQTDWKLDRQIGSIGPTHNHKIKLHVTFSQNARKKAHNLKKYHTKSPLSPKKLA